MADKIELVLSTGETPEIELDATPSPGGNVQMGVTAGTSIRTPVDKTLSVNNMAADAKVTGNRIRALEAEMPGKVNKPALIPDGQQGQYLRSNGDGTTVWESIGAPTDEQVAEVMEAWLDDHPEATTSVQDGSITYIKLHTGLQSIIDTTVNGAYVEDGSLYLTHDGEVVAGPFSGFGGGGGGGSMNNAVMTLDNVSGWAAKTVAKGATVAVAVSWSSIEDGLETGNGTLTVKVDGLVREVRNVAQGVLNIDISNYLNIGTSTVQILVADSYGNTRMKNFTLSVMDLRIASSFDQTTVQTGAFNFQYIPYGEVRKTVFFEVDGVQIGTDITAESGNSRSYSIPVQTHGAHDIDVYFTCTVNGEEITSNTLHYEVIWAISGQTATVIATEFDEDEIEQYETLNIPYRVYDPQSQVANVTISIDGVVVSSLTDVSREPQVFSYRMDTEGEHTITIASNGVARDIDLTVNEAQIDAHAETQNLALYLSSAGRSNNEEHPDTWTYGEGAGEIAAVFTGFNWKSDGWQQDGDGITVLRVNGGAEVEIPYQIFAEDFRTTGKTIEIEFATRDVHDYDATILSCMSGGRGFSMTAQYATMKSEQSELNMQYKEDDHIRLTFVVEKRNENRLMMVYVNAIPSGVIQYAADDDFSQVTPVNITIGNEDCGIDIYNIRVYDNNLTRRQVLWNWVADTQSGALMSSRYHRNNVYDMYGKIVISQLPGDLPYMILEAEELPQYKGDKKTITGSYTDPSHPEKSFTFTGCQINVQGTSSAPYARKNYDMQFKQGFIMSNGTTANNYALTDSVVPFNRFVMKADVASSEGANNVELVKLYCELTPFKSREAQADSKVRAGIYGFPIVIFWRNPATGTTSFLGKYNFNFPKRAPGPYGYSGDMESWEFQNNTSNLMLFKTDYFDETMIPDPDTGEEKEAWRYDYEARFPDDTWTDYSKLQELQSFIYSTYRAEATNDALAESVTYDGVTYTADTAAYRLAKFKNEFGNYAEVNSFIFYYIFTELFLMVDSRAKNLFIGFNGSDTEEGETEYIDRKAVAEPYDMDTALGTNNEGSLVFSYNLEDTDHLTGGANVFNGQDSVLWNNVRDAFGPEIQQMYQTMRSSGKLSYAIVENRFEEHQSKWPEAIWAEDSWFKYIDPLIAPDSGKEPTDVYLPMMQGSKLEQRKWWLMNRFRYMDSKLNAGDALSQVIQLRAYAKANVTVTPYADIYATVKYASYLVQSRATHGVSVTLVCPVDELNDTEVYIYSAPQVADVGDLSGLKVGFADFSAATRLQSVKLGDGTEGYENPNLNYLSLGTNPLIKTVDVKNCTALGTGDQKSVDLTGCVNVENVYFDNTAVTSVALPNGGVMKKLHLPGTITNLTVRNQSGITEFDCPDFSNITTLWLENPASVIDTFEIVDGMPEGGRVRLFGFHWEMDDLDDVSDIFDKLDTMRGLDQSGNNTPTAQVYGSIHVVNATGSQYAEISARYPDVRITYDHITSTLKYYNGETLLKTETVVDGGNGTGVSTTPTKEQTAQYTYTFAGWNTDNTASEPDADALNHVVADRDVYAIFAATLRSYTITFIKANIDGGGTLQSSSVNYGETPVYSGTTPTSTNDDGGIYTFDGWTPAIATVTGSQTYTAHFRDDSVVVNYYNGSTLLKTERILKGTNGTGVSTTPTKEQTAQYTFTFAGWNTDSTATTADANALNNVTTNRDVYAIFTNTLRSYTITFVKDAIDGGGTLQTKTIEYGTVPTYTGTEPTTIQTGYEFNGWIPSLTAVTGDATYTAKFVSDTSMTRQFIKRTIDVAENSETTKIGDYAFAQCYSLITASFQAVTSIGSGAFRSCTSLTTISFPSATEIGSYAFAYCRFITSLSFPVATSIYNNAFTGCSSVTTAYFPSAIYIGNSVFERCDKIESLYSPSVTSIGISALAYCYALTTASFSAVTQVNNYAFQGCSALATVSFPHLTYIGDHAFKSCKSLETISFPEATHIGNAAFYNCTSLNTVLLPATSEIYSNAFFGCSSLTTVILSNSSIMASFGQSVFYNASNAIIYVADELLSNYKAQSNLASMSASRIKPISELPA